ncbi:protein ALWAYS EARLY 2 isoform X2 [Hevea brasiliensis]|uniref:protein ALWAYS EARLY 2 isoform X2 n=1 Tax=Hevea brasiliensis TaxID=3981 RepID=UPI0025CC5194|nr:protein ALWAYS EARLY 2 isoform X2 [Hevea brasiliensis]
MWILNKSSMAPTRKKSVNKRFLNEVSPHKEVRNPNKNKERVIGKRRLSDKLGPRWSEEELQQFYKAYRVHGVEWKKIAAEVPNRSVEMVKTLFKMNKAYLSLPEGTASVVGLTAMMTDHYYSHEVSDSEGESNDVPGMSRKPQKSKQAKIQLSASKDLQQSRSIASTDGYLSLLKKGQFYGGQPRAVGKRTPRIAVSYPYKKNDSENYVSQKKGQKSENDVNDDGVHVAALALAEALQKGGSPQVSPTQCRRTEHIKSSPVRSWDMMSKSSHSKLQDAFIDEELMGDGISRGADSGAYARDASSLVDMEGVGTVEVHPKGNKFYRKKVKVEERGNCQSDDGGEACSGTEEGPKINALKGKTDIDESNAKTDERSPQARKKISGKHFSGDEFSALDALQTLANLSVMESESSVQLNEERMVLSVDDKFSKPEAISTSHHRDKLLGYREKVFHPRSEVEGASRKSKLGRNTATKPVSKPKQGLQSINNNINALKRKRHSLVSKVSNAEAPINLHLSKPLEAEPVDEEEIISALKGKRTCLVSAVSKQSKATGLSAGSVSGDQKSSASDVAISTAQVPVASQVTLPTSKISRRKMSLKQSFIHKEGHSSENILKNQANRYSISLQDTAPFLKGKFSSCLSSPMVRRWCTFEWFYSAIDYPWFAKREFVEYLNHVGLGHIPRLTRVEWGVIRSSLGKPRRFSEHFLHEEREKLKQYRDSVRKHYTELRTGIMDGLPTDLARPLSVGQRVIAVHPKTRELHDGSVLTIDHDRCRVQFDCPEMGVEFVKDIDCMPLNPFDNMPEALRRGRFSVASKELQVNGHSHIGGFTSPRRLDNLRIPMNTLVKQVDANHQQSKAASIDIVSAQQIASQPSVVSQLEVKEVDVQALSELNHALDKKASSALVNLRQHNTCPGNTLPPWLKPPVNSNFLAGPPSSHDIFVSQESGSSTVIEIVGGSRHKAHTMIDAAVQAISSMKEGEDAFVKIGEALDSIDKGQLASEPKAQVIRSPEHVNGILNDHDQLISSTLEAQVNGNASGPKSQNNADKIEAAIPEELITSCVATLLMIQTCTERQYPPADVAQIIDSAVTSLHPYCPQNQPIYREIQMCMGRIKTQILALIPT